MYRDVEEMLTRELRGVADHVTVPPLPELPTAPPPARFAWQPVLVAAALVLVALATVASLLRMDDGRSPQPAPRPTDVVTDGATEAAVTSVPTGPPAVPYVLDRVLHVADRTYPGYDVVDGTTEGWLAGVSSTFSYSWGNTGRPRPLDPTEQPPTLSPDGELLAWVTTEGELNGLQTDPAGEGFGLGIQVPVRGDDGIGTRVTVTDDGLVVASATGVSVLWRPFVDGKTVDLAETAPDQQVLESTPAGVVVQDDTAGPSGSVYLADLTPDGTLTEIARLPDLARLEVTADWIAGFSLDDVGGDTVVAGGIEVRRLEGGGEAVLTPPAGWQFADTRFAFEDDEFLVARVTDGAQERMVRCSPALRECLLLDAP